MNRYARQMCLPEIGAKGQAQLSSARILVVGAGGLGATVLPALAGAGCGTIRVVDHDRVDESNLHRQTLFRMSDIGQPKATSIVRALTGLNPDCRIEPFTVRLYPALARQLVTEVDVVVDAADSIAATYALSDVCLKAGIPLVSASVLGRTGYAGGFCGSAPSYRAVFPDLPPVMANCASAGVMGPAVAMLGALQAQMTLSILLGHRPSPAGQMMSVDLANWRVSSFRFDHAPEPEVISPAIVGTSEILQTDIVIELRGEKEAPNMLAPARRMTGEDLENFDPPEGRRVVFVCATGLRAWRAAKALSRRWPNPVAVLAAGT